MRRRLGRAGARHAHPAAPVPRTFGLPHGHQLAALTCRCEGMKGGRTSRWGGVAATMRRRRQAAAPGGINDAAATRRAVQRARALSMHLTRSGRLKAAARPQPPGGGGGRFIRGKAVGCNQILGTVNGTCTFERQLMRRKSVGPTASLTSHCMLAPLRLLPHGCCPAAPARLSIM